jgi:LuxR family maltose regulon positive regulatory protein
MTSLPALSQGCLPLLRTKLFPADAGVGVLLARDALIERLLSAGEHRLIILSAPAGFGKSTVLRLLHRRLQEAGRQVAWLSCDESDSEPQRLLQYLVAAIEVQLPGFGANTARLLQRDMNLPGEALVDAFVTDLKREKGELYLMLDDFHLIRHPAVEPLVDYLLGRVPANVRLVTSTRFQSRFVEKQSGLNPIAFWVSAEDLRLTRDETRQYFHEIKRVPLSGTEVELLHARTEGWITALHLAALALVHHPDRHVFLAGLSGTERNIADYLAEDVLDRLPGEMQQFLEQTSLLEEFNAQLCNTLTGRSDSREMLRRLHREQLFIIALDAEGEWFRYHHLFAEFLQGRLAKRGDPAHLLHAAACWCEGQDLADKSIKYALRARNYIFAAQLLERQGARLIAANRVYGVLSVLKNLPAQVIREHPVFQIFYAWQLAFEQQYAQAEAMIEDVSTRLLGERGKALHLGLAELLASAQVLKALVLLYQDKLENCLQLARHWLSLVPDNQPVFRAVLSCVQAAAHALLGDFDEASTSIARGRDTLRETESEYLQVVVALIEVLICKDLGQLGRGRTLAENARSRVERVFGRRSRVGGPLALAYADLLYEQDRHAAILAELPLATTWRDVATPIELISRGKLVMARGRFFAGEAEQALVELDEWLQGLHGAGYQRVFALGMSCKVHFLLWLRRPNDAERTCLQLRHQLGVLPQGRYSDADIALVLAEARLTLSERRADKAQAVLERCLATQTADHQRDRHLRLSILLCVAYWRRGNCKKAFSLLLPTVESAWNSGYRRLFLDDALWLLPLWNAWSAAQPQRASAWQGVAEQLREQCRRMAIDPETVDDSQDVSHREREILRFVAAGLSNREIARTLHLSEATIKWHLHNLFAKFAVRSRTQAVLKGKSIGLLSEA